jgi:hypothetical protein
MNKNHRLFVPKAIASLFLVTALFAVALTVPNPITGTPEAKASDAAPTFGATFQPYIPSDGNSVKLQQSNAVIVGGTGNLSLTAPDPARFTVMVGTSPNAVANPVTSVAIVSGWILQMNVTNRITKDAVVTVAYSASPTLGTSIQTNTGVAALEFGIPVPLPVANNQSTFVQTVPNAPGASNVVVGEESATITVSPPTSGPAPTSYEVTASPGGKTCTVTVPSLSCTITGLTAGTAYTFTTVAKTASGSSPAGLASASATALPKVSAPTSTVPAGYTPSWDNEPLTDSETDANTVGYMPTTAPGKIIITDEFGFMLDNKNGIKPNLRMKNYAGKIKMTISAKYKDGAKTKNYKCVFAPFGSTKTAKTAKWKWYTPKKACILPAPLVAAIRANTATLSANGTWTRQWLTTGKTVRADKTKIKARKMKYTVKAKPAGI